MKEISKVEIKFDGEYFNEILKERNMTRKDFLLTCGIDSNDLSAYIHNRVKPSLRTLYRMALALDVFIEDLLKEC